MMEMLRKVGRVFRDERGIETAEWTVILGFIVLVAVVVYYTPGSGLQGLLTGVYGGITTALAPLM